MFTLSGCIVYRRGSAAVKMNKSMLLSVRVIHILPVGFVSLDFHVYFLFCCLLITSPHIGNMHCLFSDVCAGVSDSFGEVRVYPRSISPQLAALSCQEWFTLQKTCSDTWGMIWVWLSLSVIAAASTYRICFSVQKQSLACNVFLDYVCCNAWLVNVHNIYWYAHAQMHTQNKDYS